MQRALRGRREIVVATDYAEALVLLDDARRWCGLMFDVHLPRAPRGGPDLLQRARSRGCWAPAILVSGELQPALLGEAAELNARYVPFECLTQKALVAFAHESVAWDLGVSVGMLRAFTYLPHHDELTHAEAEVALMLGAGYSAARVPAHREIGERGVSWRGEEAGRSAEGVQIECATMSQVEANAFNAAFKDAKLSNMRAVVEPA